eukprot:CAMPEP_0117681468 /NCGR_PEP_ID=MMETSP0804-20121206/19004_1 /TAXON_ID=1074897 /ORGANISM="Tetraselmis astigmatica, Strain CCMP880" /LENGTH=94 /DNA_ID=CAMNT_0005491239 /DNA_START=655 /DNA_END=940 /DNA_ORIENTATION=+
MKPSRLPSSCPNKDGGHTCVYIIQGSGNRVNVDGLSVASFVPPCPAKAARRSLPPRARLLHPTASIYSQQRPSQTVAETAAAKAQHLVCSGRGV